MTTNKEIFEEIIPWMIEYTKGKHLDSVRKLVEEEVDLGEPQTNEPLEEASDDDDSPVC